MLKAIADTHAIIWYLRDDPRLSQSAKDIFTNAVTEGNEIGFSSITLAEIIYLIEKRRISSDSLADLLKQLDEPDTILVEVPFNREIANTMLKVERSKVPDLPDRIIAATALSKGIPLLSRDGKIQTSGIATIW